MSRTLPQNNITLPNKLQSQTSTSLASLLQTSSKSKLKSNHAVKPTIKQVPQSSLPCLSLSELDISIVTNQSARMAPRDDQFEAQIEPYRRERRLLVARNIYWEATRAEFETTVRTRLTMGDTVSRFFWLPQTDRRFRRNNKRHRGYVFILFNTKQDAQRALRELRPFDFHGRRVMIDFAGREAVSLQIYFSHF